MERVLKFLIVFWDGHTETHEFKNEKSYEKYIERNIKLIDRICEI